MSILCPKVPQNRHNSRYQGPAENSLHRLCKQTVRVKDA